MSKTILLLDDDSQFRDLVRPILEHRGIHVLEAFSGAKATHFVLKEKLDLIIVDGVLPDVDGVGWIKQLRKSGNKTKIIFISAHRRNAQDYHQMTKDLDVSLILHKPIIPSAFGEQVAEQLENPPLSPETETNKTENLRNKLAAITRRYAAELPAALDELSQALNKAKENPQNNESVAEARLRAHKLRGTAGSYGFQPLGEVIAKIEDKLHSLGSSNDTLTWMEITESLAEAMNYVNQYTRDAQENSAQDQPVAATIDNAEFSPHSVNMATILVVDDDKNFLDLIEEFGRQRLIEIIRAETQTEALSKANEFPLDGALIDVQLGEGDFSFELAKQLRDLPGHEELPLAFVSTAGHFYSRVAAAHAGGSLYLNKPLDPDTFESTVQHLLSIKHISQPRVLIIDDDKDFMKRVAMLLQHQDIGVNTLSAPLQILEVLDDINPDLLLLDLNMPDINGFDVCRMLRTISRWQDLPIIFLTAHIGLDVRVDAFKCGGDDYLPKPYVDEELLSRVKLRLERARLLKDRSDKDAITGLWLRRPFMEQINAILAGAKQVGFPVTLGLIDIDNFKTINDTYGHLAGDNVLAGLGRLLTRRFQAQDLRGRWGGDELIVAWHGMAKEDVLEVATRFIQEFNSISFTAENGQPFKVSLSAGLASFPLDSDSVYDLIQIADRRLYTAKHTGRGKAVCADQSP